MDRFKKTVYGATLSGDDGDGDGDGGGAADNVAMKERVVRCAVYFWRSSDRVVLSDVDGTITKSDVGGHIWTKMGFEFVQKDIVEILERVNGNGHRLIYLTARGIGQCAATRKYLFNDLNVPYGAVLCSPSTLRAALYREVVQKRPQQFKIPTLSAVQWAFGGDDGVDGVDGKGTASPFVAGFGNRDTDAISYAAVGVPVDSTFIIGLDKKEKAKAKEQGVVAQFVDDYAEILKNANTLFPKVAM